MNMPPPHGPGGHPGHPGLGASSPSPGMMNRPHPHAQQLIPQHPQQQYMDSPNPASHRGRKRKLTAQTHHHPHPSQQQHLARRPSMHGAPPPHHGGHPQHSGQHGFPGRSQAPPFLGLNLPPTIADEMPESIFDDLDRLTPRDIAVARYARNHELLSIVFDARRIDTLTPAPSPYADVKQDDLKNKVASIQEEVIKMAKEHEERLRELKESSSAKKNKKQRTEAEEGVGETPAWAESASRGKILGVGFVRAETPEELRPPKPAAEPATEASMEVDGNGAAEKKDEAVKEKAAEAEEVRKHAEKEAIEKLNIELGVTPAQAPEAPPAEPAAATTFAPAAPATIEPAAPADIAATAATTTAEAAAPTSADIEPPPRARSRGASRSHCHDRRC
ncbi:hypothetical protein NDA15_001608 [Ustilago hordei]|nr:hypothetical protein NDA15_001608 [Ustilago hordei]